MNATTQPHLDRQRIPAHIAIIMDGNGRWAQAKGLPRSAGHREGVETRKTHYPRKQPAWACDTSRSITFSTENWNRPSDEVATLMALILDSLQEEIFMKNNVRFRVIGDRNRLPEAVLRRLEQCEHDTAANSSMTMVVALSYSARWEITRAARRMAADAAAGRLQPDHISEETLTQYLETHFMPDPELLIRTGGELRLSNYLLWQCAYTELYFTDTYWPDFSETDFREAITQYQHRQRRFGKPASRLNPKPRHTPSYPNNPPIINEISSEHQADNRRAAPYRSAARTSPD